MSNNEIFNFCFLNSGSVTLSMISIIVSISISVTFTVKLLVKLVVEILFFLLPCFFIFLLPFKLYIIYIMRQIDVG